MWHSVFAVFLWIVRIGIFAYGGYCLMVAVSNRQPGVREFTGAAHEFTPLGRRYMTRFWLTFVFF